MSFTMKYDTALFISARLSSGEMAANDDTIDACLGPAATCGRAFLAPQPQALGVVDGVLLFQVLQ